MRIKQLTILILFCLMSPNVFSNQIEYKYRLIDNCPATDIMEEPDWHSKEVAKLADKSLVAIVEKEKKIRGGELWIKVLTKEGIIGWTISEFLRNVHTNLSPLAEMIDEESLVGSWDHGSTEVTYYGKLILYRDHKFLLKGFIKPHFNSKGTWSFDNKKKYLRLDFVDNKKYWVKWFKVFKKKLLNNYNIVDHSYENTYVVFSLIKYEINFFGYNFHKEEIGIKIEN